MGTLHGYTDIIIRTATSSLQGLIGATNTTSIVNKLCLCLPSEIVCCRMEESGETLERAQPVLAGLGLVL